jgi:DNA-binding MarR family transcriptional regulator
MGFCKESFIRHPPVPEKSNYLSAMLFCNRQYIVYYKKDNAMDFTKELREIFLMEQLYATLFSVANKLQIRGDQYFKGLTSRQFMTMMAVLHLPENETTLSNIAKKLGTSKQNVNILVTAIAKKGYIAMAPSVRDKRAVNVKITEAGKQVMLECNEKGLGFLADVFTHFSTEEMETLWSLLKKLYCFDGEEQDGFEENTSGTVEVQDEYQIRILQEFARRRNRS